MTDKPPEDSIPEKSTIAVSQLVTGAANAAFAIDDYHQVAAWNSAAASLRSPDSNSAHP